MLNFIYCNSRIKIIQFSKSYSFPKSFFISCHPPGRVKFLLEQLFSFQGVGTVVSGTLLQGMIRLNDTLLLGPDALGHFQPITVKSIHRKRMPVREVKGGQTASFSLKKVGNHFCQ